jgi:archaetidylinositol phosphate synthase
MHAQTETLQTQTWRNAPRVHTAVTADLEKRVLIWLAQRTPAAIGPDHLTALGFASQLLAGAAYAVSGRDPRALWAVSVFLCLNWLGDSLDGTLARVRNQQRPRYGFYVDHMVDTFGTLALLGGLAASGYVHVAIAAGMLAGYYVLAIESYLATYTIGRFHLSHGWFGPTELRLLLIAGNAALFVHPSPKLFNVGGAVGIVGMAAMAIAATARHTAALYREETLR